MANDKRFIVKNGLSGPTVRFANGSNTSAVLDFNYGADGTLSVVGNTTLGTLITIRDSSSSVLTVNGDIAFGTSNITINSTFYEATANNASFLNGRIWETAGAIGSTVANTGAFTTLIASSNTTFSGNTTFYANTVFNSNAVFNNGVVASGSLGASGSVLTSNGTSVYWGTSVANSAALQGATWQSPLGIGTVTPNTGSFTTLTSSGNTTFSGNSTFWSNTVFNSNAVFNRGLVANNSLGDVGFVLVSNGSSVYWSNATAIAGTVATANNATYLGGFLPAYYTNATNISTGTLAEARLPFRMNQNVRTTDDVTFANGTFTGNISIAGNLILTGNLISSNIQTLSVIDPMIKLASNNAADTLWTGFVAHYSGSGNTNNHTGLLRNPTSKEYILISTYGDEVSVNNNIIVTSDTSLTYANLAINTLRLGNTSSVGTLDANSYSGTANNTLYAYGKQESQLYVANSANSMALQGATWQAPLGVGTVTANTGAFTTLTASANAIFSGNNVFRGSNNYFSANTTFLGNTTFGGGIIAGGSFGTNNAVLTSNTTGVFWTSTIANAVFATTSANTLALQGATWQAPLGVGTTTANTGAFTLLSASNVATFNANVVINYALIANNSAGSAGQILSSNGSALYWTNANNISGTVSTANNALFAYGKQESQLYVANSANSSALQGATWQAPLGIGSVTANTGAFTNVTFAVANATNYISVKNIAHLSGDSNTTSAVAQVQISSFSANTYGSAKIYIQATETATTRRHVTELLVVHDNSTAIATEYGMLFTGPTALATYEVDIVSNNVRVLATPASANTIAFRVSEQLFLF